MNLKSVTNAFSFERSVERNRKVLFLSGKGLLWLLGSMATGGKCFLVAQHCREAIGEEALYGKPEIQEALRIFKDKPGEGMPYVDLTGQKGNPDEALDDLFIEEWNSDENMEGPSEPNPGVIPQTVQPPPDVLKVSVNQGWHEDDMGNPMVVGFQVYAFKVPFPRQDVHMLKFRSTWGFWDGTWKQLEEDVRWEDLDDPQSLIPGGPAAILVTKFRRSSKRMLLEDVPECIRRKQKTAHEQSVLVVTSSRKQQKALDKEIPWNKIPESQREDFLQAEIKEWKSWQDYKAADPLSQEESARIAEKPERVLRCRLSRQKCWAQRFERSISLVAMHLLLVASCYY